MTMQSLNLIKLNLSNKQKRYRNKKIIQLLLHSVYLQMSPLKL